MKNAWVNAWRKYFTYHVAPTLYIIPVKYGMTNCRSMQWSLWLITSYQISISLSTLTLCMGILGSHGGLTALDNKPLWWNLCLIHSLYQSVMACFSGDCLCRKGHWPFISVILWARNAMKLPYTFLKNCDMLLCCNLALMKIVILYSELCFDKTVQYIMG